MRVSITMRRAVVAVAVGGIGLLGIVGPAGATPKVPYTDPSAAGYLGICNRQGQQITSGSIDSVPFAWEVVSSAPAPSSVSGSGRTATLYAYQPIQGEEAGDWSGEQITGTSQYTDPSHPMAVSTDRDFALSQFLAVFPPKWDGFVELRLVLDSPGAEPQVLAYPALSLQISGATWQAVGGGSVDCTGGRAESDEVILPTTTTANGGSGSQSSSSSSTGTNSATGTNADRAGSSSPPSSGPGNVSKANDPSDARGSGVPANALAVSKSSNVIPLVVLIAVALLLIAIAAWIVIRSRRRKLSPS
jgi:hypothetical protein